MRFTPLMTATALALTLGACGGTTNTGLESVHQPVVSRTDYVIEVDANGGSIGPQESARLVGWFDALKLGYGDRIAVDDPAGGYGAHNDVAAIAARYGLLIDEQAPVTAGGIAPGMVRVIVSRKSASVPGCPDWSRQSQPEYESATMSNFGCATNANLAAMVANPEDLIHGQEGSATADAATSGKAIKSYRDKALTGAGAVKSESTRSGGQ